MSDHQEKIAEVENATFQRYFAPSFLTSYNKVAEHYGLHTIQDDEDVEAAFEAYSKLTKLADDNNVDLSSEANEKVASNELSEEDLEYVKAALADTDFISVIQEALEADS